MGLKRLEDWNKASTMRHIWNVSVNASSLRGSLDYWLCSKREELLVYMSKYYLKPARGVGENF